MEFGRWDSLWKGADHVFIWLKFVKRFLSGRAKYHKSEFHTFLAYYRKVKRLCLDCRWLNHFLNTNRNCQRVAFGWQRAHEPFELASQSLVALFLRRGLYRPVVVQWTQPNSRGSLRGSKVGKIAFFLVHLERPHLADSKRRLVGQRWAEKNSRLFDCLYTRCIAAVISLSFRTRPKQATNGSRLVNWKPETRPYTWAQL